MANVKTKYENEDRRTAGRAYGHSVKPRCPLNFRVTAAWLTVIRETAAAMVVKAAPSNDWR